MLGGCSIQITTAVMQYGYRIVEDLKSGLNLYLKEKGYDHVKEVIGLGLDTLSAATDILERDTIVFPRFVRENCIGCGACENLCPSRPISAITVNGIEAPYKRDLSSMWQ